MQEEHGATDRPLPHVGVTSLALMSFLAGGHLPGRGHYGPTVDRCLDFVLGCVQKVGVVCTSLEEAVQQLKAWQAELRSSGLLADGKVSS